MEALIQVFRENPELAVFLTLALGFWLGNLRLGQFSLGVVTSTLIAGVLVGQMRIDIAPQVKSVFFLMFLFAVGYGVGPQFFSGLRKDGVQLVVIGVVLCVSCLLSVYLVARVAGLNTGQAAGLLAGACTMSAVLGVATDTVNTFPIAAETKSLFISAMPVAYAVSYLFGTAGSAWVLATLGPKILRVNLPEECARYEKEMGGAAADSVGHSAYTRFVVRAYRLDNPQFHGATIETLERHFGDVRVFVLRVRSGKHISDAVRDAKLERGDVLAVIGRREVLLDQGALLGVEVDDRELLDFPGEILDVVVTRKEFVGKTLQELADGEEGRLSRGVYLRKLTRGGTEVALLWGTRVARGDVLQVVGPTRAVARVAESLGYADRATEKTDVVFMGLGVVVGGLLGTLTIHLGGVPLSLSTSGGALLGGLFCGWLRSVNRTFGRIPAPALWVFNQIGLNVFIAIVGITSGPTFIAGVRQSGLTLLVAGIVATTLPFVITLLFGKYVLRMHPGILLGACAGGRTTTAALGAIEEVARSRVPSLGYSVPYAIGNVLLITWGVVIVLLMK